MLEIVGRLAPYTMMALISIVLVSSNRLDPHLQLGWSARVPDPKRYLWYWEWSLLVGCDHQVAQPKHSAVRTWLFSLRPQACLVALVALVA